MYIYIYIYIYRYVYCRGLTASAADPRSKIRCHEFNRKCNPRAKFLEEILGSGGFGVWGGLGDSGPLTWWLGDLGGLGGGSGGLAGLRGPGGLGA
jgi:hypothetical protein